MTDVEEWRDIPGYEGCYQVSNGGLIRSLDRYDRMGRLKRGRVLAFSRSHNGGYLTLTLKVDGRRKTWTAHRLVALAFLDPPKVGQTDVCHGNAIKTDNRVENLRWGTRSENLKEHAESGRYKNQNTKKTHWLRGHEFNESNTYWVKPSLARKRVNPSRVCKTCAKARMEGYRAR